MFDIKEELKTRDENIVIETKKKKNRNRPLKFVRFVKVKLILRRADAHTAHQIWILWTDLLGQTTVCSFVIG